MDKRLQWLFPVLLLASLVAGVVVESLVLYFRLAD